MFQKFLFFHFSNESHERRSVGGQGDMSPLLFEVEWTPCVLRPPPYFLGVDIVLTVSLILTVKIRRCSNNKQCLLTVTPCIGVHCSNFNEIYAPCGLRELWFFC